MSLTHAQVQLVEAELLDRMKNYLQGNIVMRVGTHTTNPSTRKMFKTIDGMAIPDAHELYGDLRTTRDAHVRAQGEGVLVISHFTLTPVIYDPNNPKADPKRGIMVTTSFVPNSTKGTLPSATKKSKIDPLDRY